MEVFMRKKIWNEGMTLIETAVVVSIIGIISALAVPTVIGFMPRYQLSSQVSAIQNDVQRAKIKSISLNTIYRIRFYLNSYPTADIYRGYFYDPDSGSWTTDTEMFLEEISKNVDIARIDSDTSGVFTMYFLSDGTCISGNIYFTNTLGQKKRIEILETTGFIKAFDSW
jgi:prepilin-type N-terminal cleavage/methylation domain-containing protein